MIGVHRRTSTIAFALRYTLDVIEADELMDGRDRMAVTQRTDARTIGKTLADEVRGIQDVHGIWARSTREGVEIWVQVDVHTDNETELEVYRIGASLLDRFPDTFSRVFVVNPLWFEESHQLVGDVIPSNATPIPLAGP